MNESEPPPASVFDEPPEDVADDFLFHFYQGGELLDAGRLREAREELDKAARLRPDNPRCQNLLGLIAFKNGEYDHAIQLYRQLVERYAEDATLRVNLATVYLKAERLDEAEAELSSAIGFEPDHEKAHRTMAVVLAKKGDTPGAREHLTKAGVMDPSRFLTSMHTGAPDAPAGRGGADEVEMAAAAAAPSVDLGISFRADGPTLDIAVQGRLYTRLAGLTWMEGDLGFTTVKKRFGGQPTKYPFDAGLRAMICVEGDGRLHFQANADRFHAIVRDEQPGYYLEEYVFAFGNVFTWENGRLPYKQEDNLPIFHLRGPAHLVLACPGTILRHRMEDHGRYLLDVRALVGWSGDLLPRLVKLDRPLPGGLWMELTGMGEVLYLGEGA